MIFQTANQPFAVALIEFHSMFDALLFAKTPRLLTQLYPDCLWRMPKTEKKLYLTFDDGPIPEVTPFVLDELKRWNARATFFCIGKNVEAHPSILRRILKEGHSVGNHTSHHLNGWKVKNELYFQNVRDCTEVLQSHKVGQHLFRPPYGKLKPSQYRKLKNEHRIVMWDVLSFDFDLNVSKERVLRNVTQHARSGSIVVMHDSLKAKPKVEYALPRLLKHFHDAGFTFEAL